MADYKILEDVNHMGGKKEGDIVTCPDGERPRGQLAALIHFGQAELVDAKAAADAPRRGKAPAKVAADKQPATGTSTGNTGEGK